MYVLTYHSPLIYERGMSLLTKKELVDPQNLKLTLFIHGNLIVYFLKLKEKRFCIVSRLVKLIYSIFLYIICHIFVE